MHENLLNLPQVQVSGTDHEVTTQTQKTLIVLRCLEQSVVGDDDVAGVNEGESGNEEEREDEVGRKKPHYGRA